MKLSLNGFVFSIFFLLIAVGCDSGGSSNKRSMGIGASGQVAQSPDSSDASVGNGGEEGKKESGISEQLRVKISDSVSSEKDKVLPSENFYLGDGLDVLTGERKSSCVLQNPGQIKTTEINQGLSTVTYIQHKTDLYSKLDVGFELELGGVYQLVAGKISNSVKVMKEYFTNTKAVTVIASYRYETVKKSVYGDQVQLTKESKELLRNDKLAFRSKCGDQFVSEATVGGELYLVFSATQKESGKHSVKDVKTALEVFLTGIFNVKVGNEVRDENKNVINDLNITIKCFNQGGSPNICAETGLETADISKGDSELRKMVQNSKVMLAKEIEAGAVVNLKEKYSKYPVPLERGSEKYWDVYENPDEKSEAIGEWNALREKVLTQCEQLGYFQDECSAAVVETNKAIKNCAEQSQWAYDLCTQPADDKFSDILNIDMIGSVTIKEEIWLFPDAEKTLNFNAQLDSHIRSLVPNKIYNLRDDPYKFEDKATHVKTNLKEGWVITLFEHPGGAGDKISFEGNQGFQDLGSLKKKVSSFMLEKK